MVAYSEKFYDEMADHNRASAEVVVPMVLSYVPARSVIDVGCGEGLWTNVFQKCGVADVCGVDGEWVKEERLAIPKTSFIAKDLEKPLALGKKFDLAVSLEVAEHLSASVAAGFVKNLVDLAPVVLFSAAIPLQGGSRHINEQWPEYWAALFKTHGYVPVDCIRRKIWDDKRVSFFYAQNILFFVKESALVQYPGLQKEVEMGNGNAPAFVHPYVFLYYAERWRMLVPYLGMIPLPILHFTKRILSWTKKGAVK